MLKRICTVAWSLTGLAAVAYFAGQDIEPDHVFGMVARSFLPTLLPGLVGLFLASVLASVMSSCDAFMIASAALFTENTYKKLSPNKSQSHYLLVARIVSLLIVVGGVAFAFWLPGVIKGLEIFWMVPSMMGLAFWLGLFWRRTTIAGAWASTLTSLGVWWLTSQEFFVSFISNLPFADSLRLVAERRWGTEMYLPWQMLFYLTAGLVTGILVSLLTKPVAKQKLDTYYALTRTPVKTGEKVKKACTLPEGAIVPPARLLTSKANLEIPIPSKNAVLGFLAGWGCVILIIAVVYFIAKA